MTSRLADATADVRRGAVPSHVFEAVLLDHLFEFVLEEYPEPVRVFVMPFFLAVPREDIEHRPAPSPSEVESFFKTLKGELLHATSFVTMRQLRKHIKDYIECFYNSQRLHSGLGYRTPLEFEGIN